MTASTIFPGYTPGLFLTDRGNEISTLDERYRSIAELSPRALADRKPRSVSVTVHVGQSMTRTSLYVDCPFSMPVWIEPIVKQLGGLLSLQPNWDNDRAGAVKQSAIQNALDGLFAFMGDQSPIPQLTPTRDGGIQLDWHECGVDLEMAFEADSEGYAVFSDLLDSSRDWDGPVGTKNEELRKLFSERLNRE